MVSENQESARLLLASIIESSDDAIISKTLKSIITSWNRGAERLFGYTAAEAIGQSVLMLIPPERHGEEALILARLSRGERIEHYETIRQRKDGSTVEISLTVSPIQDETGRIIGASKIARDITARKQAERTAQEHLTRLNLALQVARLGDWSWDLATDVVTLSPRAAEILGLPAEGKVTWADWQELLHPEDSEKVRLSVAKALAEKNGYDIEYRFVRSASVSHWLATSGQVTLGADGQPKGMLGIVQDITERKLARGQLEEERERLETINRVGQLLSAELSLDKLVQSLTDAATEITGAEFGAFFYNVLDEKGGAYTLYVLSGVSREHFADFPMPRATNLFGPTFRGEGVVRVTDVKLDPRYGTNAPYFGMPHGHLPVASYLAVPVISRTGEVLGGLFFGHSQPGVFTEQHERIVTGLAGQAAIAMDNANLYEAAQKARREAEAANRLKDDFLATVSHELRTPLNAIFGWARMLSGGRLDAASATRAIQTIERNARAQEQIIEDILDVSRIITGKIRLDVSPIELNTVIEAAVDTLRPTAETRNVRLLCVLDNNSNLVLGDATRLQQIIWNLIANAIKFTPKGGRVQVTLARVNSHVEIKVSDTGQGISKEFLPHVFERFRQADSSSTREHGGLGLGLALVRHLTELHGGTVVAESAGLGQGAVFTVMLPLAALKERDEQEPPLSTPKFYPLLVEGLERDLRQELASVRVLIVDDEADARDLLRIMLRQYGAEVRTASSTSEALTLLKDWHPDVLISDIGMPGQDGFALIHEVRTLSPEEGRNTPAIALTAFARSEDRLKALRAGFHTHIAKPVEPAELSATIAGLVRSYKRPN